MSASRATAPGLVVAPMLALLGVVAIGASFVLNGHAVTDVSSANVAVDSGAANPGDIRANNSPALAQNPRRPDELAIVNRVDTPAYACGLHVSRDGGAHWRRVAIPIPRGEEAKCYAPDVAFAADGTLHVSYVTLRGTANEPHALWVARSADSGRTLTAPVRVAGPLAFQARLTTDPRRPGRLYVAWLQPDTVGLYLFAATGNRIVVARSDDGGRSWGAPARC